MVEGFDCLVEVVWPALWELLSSILTFAFSHLQCTQLLQHVQQDLVSSFYQAVDPG
jgi:hypothetical protein